MRVAGELHPAGREEDPWPPEARLLDAARHDQVTSAVLHVSKAYLQVS